MYSSSYAPFYGLIKQKDLKAYQLTALWALIWRADLSPADENNVMDDYELHKCNFNGIILFNKTSDKSQGTPLFHSAAPQWWRTTFILIH